MTTGGMGRPLAVMFPFVAQLDEYVEARAMVLEEVERERRFVGVLHKGRSEPVERADGLFSHADNVYAELFPALAGGNKINLIPCFGK